MDIRGDRVRIGISAPHDIPVHRKEVYEAIRRENIEASKPEIQDLSKLGDLLGGGKGEEGGEEEDAE